ncbi:MAG: transposase, partial [Planctomycetes bacterium]|nr:transposase [Planctomycetota bacterium]
MSKRGDRSDEKEAFWKLVVDEWRAVGGNIREFCRSNGLKESAFYFWRRELAKRSAEPAAGPHPRGRRRKRTGAVTATAAPSPTAMFLPLTIRSPEAPEYEAGAVEIFVSGHRLRVA